MSDKKLPPCDCLSFCADDPDVHNGKARPCKMELRTRRHAFELQKAREAFARLPGDYVYRLNTNTFNDNQKEDIETIFRYLSKYGFMWGTGK